MPEVAEVRYTGNSRIHFRRAPSGTQYEFQRFSDRDLEWVPTERVEDARFFEDLQVFEVRWNTVGRLKAPAVNAAEVLSDMSYQAKRKAASTLGVGVDGNPDEETVEDAIREHVKELEDGGEN